MINAYSFASGYTGRIYIVWNKVHDKINRYELYRDGELIAESTLTDSSWSPFEQPTVFDTDNHTNLFRKDSTHKLMYQDKVNKFICYEYYVKGYWVEDGEVKEEHESEKMRISLD